MRNSLLLSFALGMAWPGMLCAAEPPGSTIRRLPVANTTLPQRPVRRDVVPVAAGQEAPAAPATLRNVAAFRFGAPEPDRELLPLPDGEPARRDAAYRSNSPGTVEQAPVLTEPTLPAPGSNPAANAESVAPSSNPPAELSLPESTASPSAEAASDRSLQHKLPIAAGPLQPSGHGLSLAEIESLALGNNPSLVRSAAEVDAARGRFVQAGLYPNPTLGYAGSEIGNEGRAGQQGGMVEQQIILGNKLALAQQTVGHEVDRLVHLLEAQRLRVLTDTRRQFYEVLVAQRTRELTGELVRISQEAVRSADVLFRNQEASRVDLLQAKVELQSSQINLDNANNRYLSAWRGLTAVVGDTQLAPTPLAGELLGEIPLLTWEETLIELVGSSPELAAARSNLNRAQWAVRQAQAVPIPDLTLQGMVQYDNATEDTVASAQFGLPIPLFNRNQGGIAAAQSEVISAQANVARLELSLRQRLAEVFERYDNARRQVVRYEQDILPQSRESLDLIGSGYRQGEFNYLSLLTAQRTYFQANLAYLQSVQELRTSSLTIRGLLLQGSLDVAQ